MSDYSGITQLFRMFTGVPENPKWSDGCGKMIRKYTASGDQFSLNYDRETEVRRT
jgi:hypothetical protein